MSKSLPHQILAELEQLGRRPDRLDVVSSALRGTMQSLRRDRLRALREGNFIAAEDWRRCGVVAGRLLQASEDRAS